MPTTRREFLTTAGAVAIGAAAGARIARADDDVLGVSTDAWGEMNKSDKPLKILFLGGTGFLGPHTVTYAMERGHELTLFNRGRRAPEMFASLETIVGNRDPDIEPGLEPLREQVEQGRRWDVVIDTSAYVQRTARATAELLEKSCDQYLFISSICAYADWTAHVGGDESIALATMEDETLEDVNTHYCELQAICENEFTKVYPARHTIIRPGLIVGPRDYSDRFTYWPLRVERGGEVLAPGRVSDPMQWIDVRDLARFIVVCCEKKNFGDYNACGPVYPSNMGELLYGCKAVTGGDATFTWIDDDAFLAEHEVRAWQEAPLWASPNSEMGGVNTWSNAKAVKAGLTTRPLADTVRDTLVYFHQLPPERQAQLRAGMSEEKEKQVLVAWHNR